MGNFKNEKRRIILEQFEAMSGDMIGEIEPVFIERKSTKTDAITAEQTFADRVMTFRYKILDATLDDEDVPRIFHIAYLDHFTMNYYQEKVKTVRYVNADTSVTTESYYPDPE